MKPRRIHRMRQYDCASYDRCLDRAAHGNWKFQFCEHCLNYTPSLIKDVRMGSDYAPPVLHHRLGGKL